MIQTDSNEYFINFKRCKEKNIVWKIKENNFFLKFIKEAGTPLNRILIMILLIIFFPYFFIINIWTSYFLIFTLFNEPPISYNLIQIKHKIIIQHSIKVSIWVWYSGVNSTLYDSFSSKDNDLFSFQQIFYRSDQQI